MLLEEDMRGKNARLSEPSYFSQAAIRDGEVVWPGGEKANAAALYSDARFTPEPLRVIDLINLLQTFPPDARVIVAGYEGGFNDLLGAKIQPVIIDGGYRVDPDGVFGPYSPRKDGIEGEHTDAMPDEHEDPDYIEAVCLLSNRAR